MAIVDRVRELAAPLAEAASVDLYDVEYNGGVVRVLADAEGGIDLEEIAALSRSLGRALDEQDLIPGRYTLEVSSPGLERPLRTPEHFRKATGSEVRIKTATDFDGPRRLLGTVERVAAAGVELRSRDGALLHVDFEQVLSARTVFEWSAQARKPPKGAV